MKPKQDIFVGQSQSAAVRMLFKKKGKIQNFIPAYWNCNQQNEQVFNYVVCYFQAVMLKCQFFTVF